MTFVDIAGLVEGASNGEGLGNRFLSHIREAQAIAHVVRCFDDESIAHVRNEIEPIDDIETINLELAYADLEVASKVHATQSKVARTGDKHAKALSTTMAKLIELLDQGKPGRAGRWNSAELDLLKPYQFLTMKPVMYVANVNEDIDTSKSYLRQVEEFATKEGAEVVAIPIKVQEELALLDQDDQGEYLNALGIEEPGLNTVIASGYRLLSLHHFFTAGPKEVKAWTVPVGTRAPGAAGAIHSDFERGFIRAEVVAYPDYIEAGGESGAKAAGTWRLEGKDYVVKDGDVVHFRFNV